MNEKLRNSFKVQFHFKMDDQWCLVEPHLDAADYTVMSAVLTENLILKTWRTSKKKAVRFEFAKRPSKTCTKSLDWERQRCHKLFLEQVLANLSYFLFKNNRYFSH